MPLTETSVTHPMSDDSFNWIDDELRRVPLPEGLLQRLRRLGKSDVSDLTDSELDQALGAVAVPEGLMSELLSVPDDLPSTTTDPDVQHHTRNSSTAGL